MIKSWLIFVSISTVVAAFLSSAHTYLAGPVGLAPWISILSLIAGAVISGIFSFRKWQLWWIRLWLQLEWIERFFLLFIFFGSVFSFLLISSEVAGSWGTSSPNNLGDLPYHVHLIQAFSRGLSFPPMDPIFAGSRLHYAYAIDLWDALWTQAGLPLQTSLVLTGICGLIMSVIALWRLGGLFLVCAFFFSGGLVFTLHWQEGMGPSSTLAWKNLFHTILITQRGYLWALPAGLFLIRKWDRYLREEEEISFSTIWIFAVLPFFHLHTFAILALWMGLSALAYRRIPWKMWPGVLLALFFVFRSLGHQQVNSALGWAWGWMFVDLGSLNRNLGSWLVIPFWISARWILKKNWKDLAVALILTFVAINVKTAPWLWDQIKILMWVYLLWTFWAVREYPWRGSLIAVISICFFWPGFLQWTSGWPTLAGRFEVQSGVDRALVASLLKGISPDDVVAADVDHRNPLLGLGQSLAMGYAGHVWSHGLPLEPRQSQLKSFLAGRPDGEALLKEIDVKWIVYKDNEELAPATWESWGFREKKTEGTWHLWGKAELK